MSASILELSQSGIIFINDEADVFIPKVTYLVFGLSKTWRYWIYVNNISEKGTAIVTAHASHQ